MAVRVGVFVTEAWVVAVRVEEVVGIEVCVGFTVAVDVGWAVSDGAGVLVAVDFVGEAVTFVLVAVLTGREVGVAVAVLVWVLVLVGE